MLVLGGQFNTGGDISQRIIYIEGDDILKSEQAFVVPLSDTAVEVIKRQVGKHPTRVFTFRGNPIRRANTKAFKNTCAKLGIEDFVGMICVTRGLLGIFSEERL